MNIDLKKQKGWYMYSPEKDGIEKVVKFVTYTEVKPQEDLVELVHCYWELKSLKPLDEDFIYHILPDACVNILFDQLDLEIAAVTALQTEHRKLNLGKRFHYVGIQLLPGVWKGDKLELQSDYVDSAYEGELDLRQMNQQLFNLDFKAKQIFFNYFVFKLVKKEFVVENKLIQKILNRLGEVKNVFDMSNVVGLSPRQLQRVIKQDVGVTPHDFLKILRIHQSFQKHYLDYYTDQSHFIRSFQKITGYTPKKYSQKFNV